MAIPARTLSLVVAGVCLSAAAGFVAWRALPRPALDLAWGTGGEAPPGVRSHLARDEAVPPQPGAVPAVLAIHGFGGTPDRTGKVADRLRQDGVRVSQVLLGGHGGPRRDFALSSWHEWQEPILAEYAARRSLGYRDVGVVAFEAGGTLVAELLNRRALEPPPRRIVLVAPFLDFADSTVPIAAVFGLHGEYNRPMWQLLDLTLFVSRRLDKGIPLTPDQHVLIIQPRRDPAGKPANAEKFRKGLRGGTVEILPVDSAQDQPRSEDHERLLTRISAFLRGAAR